MLIHFGYPICPLYELTLEEINYLQYLLNLIEKVKANPIFKEHLYEALRHPIAVHTIPILYKAYTWAWSDVIRIYPFPEEHKVLEERLLHGSTDLYKAYGHMIRRAIYEETFFPQGCPMYLWEELDKYTIDDFDRIHFKSKAEDCRVPFVEGVYWK